MQRVLALFSFCLLVASPLFATCTFDLLPAVQQAAGASPAHIETADFNNDGNVDVAMRRDGSDKITILLGTSSGQFGAPSEVTTGRTILRDIATGDFNKDGKIDLVTTNGWLPQIQPSVNILLGNGDGTFKTLIPYMIFQNPANLAVDDFDKDGKLDIAASKSNGFVLLLGLGNGHIVQKSDNTLLENSNVGHDPEALTHGDFDGDGKLDVAASELVTNRIHLFYGVGDGSFTRGPALAITGGYRALALTAGDYDRDGDADLAWGENDSYGTADEKHVNILISNGAAKTFTPAAQPYGSFSGSAVRMARSHDMDGDGDLDLVVVAMGGSRVLLNDGTGAFPTHKANSEAFAFEAAVADVDRDGGPDVLTTNFAASGKVSVFRNFCGQVGLTLTSTPNPTVYESTATFVATVVPPSGPAPTGTVAIKRRATTFGIADLSSTLSLTVKLDALPLGTHEITAVYSGDSRFAPATRTISHVVGYGPFGAPRRLVAISAGSAVNLSWIGTDGVSEYELWRSGSAGTWTHIATTANMWYVDSYAPANAAYLYRVRALPAGGGTPSAYSNIDIATTFNFTDPTITAGVTPIRWWHVSELRRAVNAARALGALPPANWTDRPRRS